MSFVNEGETEIFLCGSCGEIAHNAMLLDCHLKHHQKQKTLYCSKCALSFINTHKKCPFTHHTNPRFKAGIQERLEMDELDIICPYSVCEVIAKQHNEEEDKNNDELFVFDTDHGNIASEIDDDDEGINKMDNNHNYNHKENENDINNGDIGCKWIGKYKYLSYHIDNECKFIPIKHQLLRLKTQFNQFKKSKNKNIVDTHCLNIPLLVNVLFIFIIIGCIAWFYMEIKQINNDNAECVYNSFNYDELNKYIDDKFDDLINNKYQQIDGYYNILKADLDVFKNDIIQIVTEKVNDEETEDKYGIIDDIVTNAKSKYDGYKQRIDKIPFVKFVSDTMNKLKQKKEV